MKYPARGLTLRLSAIAVSILSFASACRQLVGIDGEPDVSVIPSSPEGGSMSVGGTPSVEGGTSASSGSGAGAESGLLSEPWTNVTSNLAGLQSECGNLAVLSNHSNGDFLIAGIARRGLWASTDDGTWRPLGLGAGSAPLVNRPSSIVYDPEEPARFWESGIYGDGVFRTDDDGFTFVQLGNVVHTDLVSVDFTDPYRKTLLAGGHEQSRMLNRSTDGGQTWEPIGDQLPDNTYCTRPLVLTSSSYLVGCATASDGVTGIYRTDDGGDSWSLASKTGGGGFPLFTTKGDIYWSDPDPELGGLTRSLDGGKTWEEIAGARELGLFTPPTELPDGRIAALGRDAVFVSADNGDSFTAATASLPYADGRGLVYSPSEQAFFIWRFTCEDTVPGDAIMRANFAVPRSDAPRPGEPLPDEPAPD